MAASVRSTRHRPGPLPIVVVVASLGIFCEPAAASPARSALSSRTPLAGASVPQAPAGSAAGRTGGGRTERNKLIGRRMLARRAWWSPRQFRCLDRLWTRESHWNHRAQEPSTGAYGIPQAHPGSKMADAGADWRSNPRTQIRWGLRYVRIRHGTACRAWGHLAGSGWY